MSQLDPCLFLCHNLLVIIYVDDLLIYAPLDDIVNTFISQMQAKEIALQREGTAKGYLGINLATINNSITMTQTGLTKRIIAALGLDDKYSKILPNTHQSSPTP